MDASDSSDAAASASAAASMALPGGFDGRAVCLQQPKRFGRQHRTPTLQQPVQSADRLPAEHHPRHGRPMQRGVDVAAIALDEVG